MNLPDKVQIKLSQTWKSLVTKLVSRQFENLIKFDGFDSIQQFQAKISIENPKFKFKIFSKNPEFLYGIKKNWISFMIWVIELKINVQLILSTVKVDNKHWFMS